MKKRLVAIAVGVLSIPVLGGAAYAVTQSVDDRPTPKVVIPSAAKNAPSPTVDDHGGNRPPGVNDDGPLHDVGDDHGGNRPAGVNDNAPSPTVDDHGGNRPPGVNDDGPLHDVGDDHGGRSGSHG